MARTTLSLAKNTLIVVVTFNPEINLLEKDLQAILLQFKHVLIVDNGSKNIAEIEKAVKDNKFDLEIRKLDKNYGIAYAQNVGLEQAKKEKFDWLLTMDQDSIIPANLTSEYQKVINENENIGMIGWNQNPKKSDPEVKNNKWIISSGCLLKIGVLSKCGGFDSKLFIDNVDHDVTIKMRNAGYKTLTTNKVKLSHQLGTDTGRKTLRGEIFSQHSPVRSYYIIRNSLVLIKRYFRRQPIWMLAILKIAIREGVYLLAYQPQKIKNLFLILRAWFDGIINRLGEFRP